MFEVFSDFHFIRPLWLFALLALVVIISGLILKGTGHNQWASTIDQHLLKHLLVGQQNIQQSSHAPILILALSLLVAILALAGPTWQKKPLAVFETEISKVILLDLSLSMLATDVKPSRLVRARHKIMDLLTKTNEGQVALIVYAGDAFVISPLTTDAKTIMTMIPPLSPLLMPVLGSEPHRAFILADELLSNAGVFSGQIIWITDGIDDRDYGLVAEQLKKSRHQLSILAVGTNEGAPIPLADGQGFLKDDQGAIILPGLQLLPLELLAKQSEGSVTRLTADDRDIDLLLSSLKKPEDFIASEDDLEIDVWVEFGPWLLIPLILVTALAFRKGVVITLLLLIVPIFPNSNIAAAQDRVVAPSPPSVVEKTWNALWKTPNQQAAIAFSNNHHAMAAELFEQQEWKSAALYKSGQFNAAVDLLSADPSATAYYNNANGLAQLGRYQESIAAYEKALLLLPDMDDATFNKTLVEQLLKQQQDQDQKEQKEQQKQDGEQQGEQQQDDAEQENNEQQGENKEQDQQDTDQQADPQESGQKEDMEQLSELEQMNEAEREQVLEQWLRMIKDDPGGLLRRKMYVEYQRRQEQDKKLQRKGEKVW